jgi:hypothetical protein
MGYQMKRANRLLVVATAAAALVASCGQPNDQAGGNGAPNGPLTNETSFGGKNDELCYQLKSNPALPGAKFTISVEPPTGLLESPTVTGTLDDRGQVALGWRLKGGTSGDWTVTAHVEPTANAGVASPAPLSISSQAGTDQTGNPQAESAPPCDRTK